MIVNQGMGHKLRDQVFHVEGGMMMDRFVQERQYSEDTAKIIDEEVEALITEAANRARLVIKQNIKYLNNLKDALLDQETVEADDVIKIVQGANLPQEAAQYWCG